MLGANVIALLSLLSLSRAQYPQTNGRFIHDNSLGEFYPYAVSLPANNSDTLAPTILSLAGKGSIFQEGSTFPIDATVSYGCAGWRASRYMNGSREEADVIVGERFITITPYVHLFDADANGEYNLTIEGLLAVIEDARTKYPIDPNRIYVGGYSAGARAIWSLLPAYPNYFAAATVCAGVPQPQDFTGLPNMTNVPLRVYAGTADYDAFSQVWMSQAYVTELQTLGSNNSNLVALEGVDHNDMQQTPYDADMFYWLLNHTNAQATPEQVSAALAPNPQATSLYSSILSYEFAFESVYSASLLQDGLPSASRQSLPAPTTTMAPLALASDAISMGSASFSDSDASLGVQQVAAADSSSSASSLQLSALVAGAGLLLACLAGQ